MYVLLDYNPIIILAAEAGQIHISIIRGQNPLQSKNQQQEEMREDRESVILPKYGLLMISRTHGTLSSPAPRPNPLFSGT